MRALTVAWVTLFVLVPGFGAALALYRPGEISLVSRVALAFGLGYAVTGVPAYALTLLGLLRAPVYFALVAAATAGVWVVALRRATLAKQWRSVVEEVRGDPAALAVGAGTVVAIAILHAVSMPSLQIGAFRYWVDGAEIAEAGRVPAMTLQYGRLYPPAESKILLNTFTAGVVYATGANALTGTAALLSLCSSGLAVALWAFARELGFRFAAPLLPALVVANRLVLNGELTSDLKAYRAEDLGRLVAVCALIVAVRALRERKGWTDAVVAAGLLAMTAATHLIPFGIALLAIGSYALGRLLVDRALRPLAVRVGAILVGGIVAAAALLLLPGGVIGFEGVRNPLEYEAAAGGRDLTRSRPGPSVSPGDEPRESAGRDSDTGWYMEPGLVYRRYVARSVGFPTANAKSRATGVLGLVLPSAALVVGLCALLFFQRELRAVIVVAWGLAVGVVATALYFSWRFDLYIPATFGVRRLFAYSSLPLILLALVALEAAAAALPRMRRSAGLVAGVAVSALVAAVVVPSARGPTDLVGPRVVPLVNVIRAQTACDARILANQRTAGVFRATTGRVAVLEGMAAVLRPEMLRDVRALEAAARDFFRDPDGNAEFLDRESIDYVVAIKDLHIGRNRVAEADPARLAAAPQLHRIWGNADFDVFRVSRRPAGGGFPSPAAAPGYRCEREPLVT